MSFAPIVRPYSDECGLALADFLSTAADAMRDLRRCVTVTVVSGDLKPMTVETLPFKTYSDFVRMYSEGLRMQDKILGLIKPLLIRRGAKAVLLQYGGFFSAMELAVTEGPDGVVVVLQAPHSFTALDGSTALSGVGRREDPTPLSNIDPQKKTKLLNLWRYPAPEKGGYKALPDTPWVLHPIILRAMSTLCSVEHRGEEGSAFILPGSTVAASNGQSILRSGGIHWLVSRAEDQRSGGSVSFRAEVGRGSDFHTFLTSSGITNLAVDCSIEPRAVSLVAVPEVAGVSGRTETCFALNLPVIALHKTDNWWASLNDTLNNALSNLSAQVGQAW